MSARVTASFRIAIFFALVSVGFAETKPLAVPFVHQEKNGCGPATIMMLEAYWTAQGNPETPTSGRQTLQSLSATVTEGTALGDMRRYLDSHGYHAFTIRTSAQDLTRQLSKGRAIIVPLELNHSASVSLHYVVVTGIDERNVWVNDPAKRKPGRMERDKFEKAWIGAGNWMLLGVPRQPIGNA
ncbi:MAG: C39 family peptidase [Bryobacteraceae bacterium]